MAYAGGAYDADPDPIETGAYRLVWRLDPTPRIQVWVRDPELLSMISIMLGALQFDVRVKSDHSVVIVGNSPSIQ